MNIVKRALFGGIYVALIVAAMLLWNSSRTLFIVLFSCFIILGILEASRLFGHDNKPVSKYLNIIDCAGGVAMLLTLVQHFSRPLGGLVFIPILIYLFVRCTIQLFLPTRNAIGDIKQSFASLLYVALPISMIVPLTEEFTPHVALAIFIFIWLYDTGAFLVGCAIGKHRLFERISPKKSWEGVAGGAIFVIAAAIVIACVPPVSDFFNNYSLSVDTWIALGITVVIAATLGDLFESLLKRTAGVKDSGNLIPGHGGILDRIDSLLFVIPATLVVLEIMSNI